MFNNCSYFLLGWTLAKLHWNLTRLNEPKVPSLFWNQVPHIILNIVVLVLIVWLKRMHFNGKIQTWIFKSKTRILLRSSTKQVNPNHSDHGALKEPKNPIWTRMLVHYDPSDLGLICLKVTQNPCKDFRIKAWFSQSNAPVVFPSIKHEFVAFKLLSSKYYLSKNKTTR